MSPEDPLYTASKPTLGTRGARLLLTITTVLAILFGTYAIVDQVVVNTDKANEALVHAQVDERVQRVERELQKERRRAFARTDYRACLVDESQDRTLAVLVRVSLKSGAGRKLTPPQQAARRQFQRTLTKLEAGRACDKLPALNVLSPKQRRNLIEHYAFP